VVTSLFATALQAHDGTDHVAEDENAAQLAQTYAPFEVAPETINAPTQTDFDVMGSWGPVINWPHIPVSAANLADGRILTWASNQRDAFPSGTEFTYATVWNPVTNTFTDAPHDSHDMFCSHQVVLEDGRVFVSGGRNHVPTTSVFDSATNTWTVLENMNRGRWYPTSAALPDGGVLTAIGSSGGNFPEVWHPGLGWKLLTGIDLQAPILDFTSHYEQNWWPYISVAPDGDVVQYGPTPNMHRFNVAGTGTIEALGVLTTDWYPKHGASVLYDEGKIILAGGAISGTNEASTNKALVIDINGATPVVTPIAPMANARKFHNAIALPNGEVLMVGGNTSGGKFNDDGTVLSSEIWNPITQIWRETADMSVPRNYHSIALLLVDGRVLSGGGGLCGNCSANHQDAQIYSPPYLFNADGSPATRPVISMAPEVIGTGDLFNVTATPGVQRFTMIKLSSTTHAVNTDQRFLNVPFVETASGQYELTAHSNVNVLTPGYYYLFALDAQGVPAIAEIIQVSADVAPSNYPPNIVQLPEQFGQPGDSVALNVVAIDIDGDAISFSATGLPDGLLIDSATGLISGSLTTVESPTVTVIAADTNSAVASMSFTWNVLLSGDGMGQVLREWWNGVSGNSITELTSQPDYPDSPAGSELLGSFEGPVNWSNNYGTRMRGYIHAPVSGDYLFWIASDDEGELWLSTDTTAANSTLIASVPGWSNSRQWNKFPEQQSLAVTLQAGQAYYIEALQKEGGGGDNLAVAWQVPEGNGASVISGIYMTPWGYSPTNRSPTVTDPGPQSDLVDSVINLAIVASDPDGDALSYSATGLPDGLSIDSGTGVVSGTANLVGYYTVTVTVDDGGGRSDAVSFNWQVILPVNNPPVLSAPANQTSIEGNSINLAISATDPDGDTLSYAATGLPTGLSIDNAEGEITGTVTVPETYTVTLTVDDGNGGSDSDSFDWVVNPPPLTVTPLTAAPVEVGSPVNYTISASGGQNRQYKWNFGDGSPETAFSSVPDITYTYTAPGRYIITLTVTEDGGDTVIVTFIQTLHQTLTASRPAVSMSVVYEKRTGGDRVWNVNPDNSTVSVFDVDSGNKLVETLVGNNLRSLAIAPDGRIWVVDQESASISIVNTDTFVVEDIVALPASSAPFAIVFDPAGTYAYVSLEATGAVLQLNALDGSQTGSVDTGMHVRHLSITADSATVLASRFITPPLSGEETGTVQVSATSPEGAEVLVIDTATLNVTDTIILHHSDTPDAENAGRGIPNYLGPATISPDGQSAWVASKQDNIKRGVLRDGNQLTHDSAVRSITSRIDLVTGLEDLAARVDHDDAGVASTALFGPNGNYLYVALEGSREVSMLDVFSSDEVARIDVGRAPQGLALSPDGQTLYVHNFMDRSITVHDLGKVLTATAGNVIQLATWDTVASERLGSEVLLGKQHFYDARDARLALQKYISCASCHNDGNHDGRTWDFTGFGEGLRNTIDLRGHAGTGQGPLHWSANFDEVQDFEGQIRGFSFGLGLMSDADFNAGTRSQPLGDPKAGLSGDLDALATYVTSLSSFPDSPWRNADGSLTADAVSGQAVFLSANCNSCHASEGFTDSATRVRHDIGTLKASSGSRLGGGLDGLDTPTLRGVWAGAPYLHDGSAATLEDAVNAHAGSSLTPTELGFLTSYLEQVDGLETVPTNQPPSITNPGPQADLEGDSINLSIVATDADSDTLTYAATGLPIGLAIDTATGDITGTATAAGTYTVILTVDDGRGGSDSATFDWLVDANPATTLIDNGDTTIDTASGLEWLDLTFTQGVSAQDVLAGFGGYIYDGWTFATVEQVCGLLGALGDDTTNCTTGAVAMQMNPTNAETLVNLLGNTVAAGRGVYGMFNNIDSFPNNFGLGCINDTASSCTTGGASSWLTLIEWASGYETVGSFLVRDFIEPPPTTTLIDNGDTTIDTASGLEWLVNSPPVLTAPLDQTSLEGDSINLTVSATDADGDTLTYAATGLPTGLAIDTATGDITGTVTLANTYAVTLTVDDGRGGSDSAAFNWLVPW
jgi:YVTN family beta-propeller protein